MKVQYTLTVGLVGCKRQNVVEVDDSDFEGMTEQEILEDLRERAMDWAWNYIEVDAELVQ